MGFRMPKLYGSCRLCCMIRDDVHGELCEECYHSLGNDTDAIRAKTDSRFLMENEGVPFRGAEVLG